jgi:kynurenine formamidase
MRFLERPAFGPDSLRFFAALAVALAFALEMTAAPAAAQAFDPTRVRLVDLTHPFNVNSIYWPTTPSGFGYAQLANGRTEGGWYYAAGAFQAPEHGGTHLDAPVHFKENGATVDQIPLERLVAPLFVIDISSNCSSNPDYELLLGDIVSFEIRNGLIPKGAAVVLRTGWSSRYGEKRQYLGDDTPGEASNLHFPGFGEEAMRVLVEQRGVGAVGLDTASLDPGKSTEFLAHRIAAAAGVPGFENLTNLDKVPAKGAWLLALPMKIEGGSGGPLRAVAMVPEGK